MGRTYRNANSLGRACVIIHSVRACPARRSTREDPCKYKNRKSKFLPDENGNPTGGRKGERHPVKRENDFESCVGFCSPLQSVTAFLLWKKVPFPCLLLFLRVMRGAFPGFAGRLTFLFAVGSIWVAREFFTLVAASYDQGPSVWSKGGVGAWYGIVA